MRAAFLFLLLVLIINAAPAAAQQDLVIYDPAITPEDIEPELPDDEQAVFDSTVLPLLKAKYQSEGCSVDPELAGEVSGHFTNKGVVQKAAFYQVCQTGNGLGVIAIVIFENGKLVGAWGDNSGWTMQISSIADMNRDGIDEFTLSFGGGMHQGMGGIGVDVVEFRNGRPVVLGWFQAEKLTDGETDSAWKVTVKPGKNPTFYRQKYVANKKGKLIKTGTKAAFRLTKVENGFELIQ